ncbi:MAG: Eco29kI family restriction endonuclease [Magnetococcales bacterium]|nr:Eco29kI family restriction endonuclease [Magnetococcales bacterium]MBF0157633.1 Eco29kI family restriction endonuclease [Magnetococcales bacterium]
MNLGMSVAEALLARTPIPLSNIGDFTGAGIYAIYYIGEFPSYNPISIRNLGNRFEVPIYVGKAVPSGARKGGSLSSDPGEALNKRLREHAKSIQEASNLSIEDFHCRFLVVDDIWIPLGEALLIAWFSPVWNTLVDGFGNHDPGRGRHQGMRPRWDTLHPGRDWALNCQERPESAERIMADVEQYLRTNPLPIDVRGRDIGKK